MERRQALKSWGSPHRVRLPPTPSPLLPWVLLLPATPPLPKLEGGSRLSRLQHHTETIGNALSEDAAAARSNAAFTTRCPSPAGDCLLLGHGERAGCRRRSLRRGLPGHGGVSSRCSTWRAGGRRQQLRQSGAGEPAGRAASGGGHPRGPGPASRGESRLRVINSFPGSRAGAAARAGSQPAQHPGRLPRLSSPTSFAPSSGDEPSWSLQALRVKPRGTGWL